MKVAIIGGEYLSTGDGIGRATQNLIHGLQQFEDVEVELKGNNAKRKNIATQKQSGNPQFYDDVLRRGLMEWRYFKRYLNNTYKNGSTISVCTADIYHAISPGESVLPVKLNKHPLVTTFYDVIPLLYDGRFQMEKAYFKHYANYAKRSDAIIAISECTKKDLIKHLNIREDKIYVIYPGIDLASFPAGRKLASPTKNVLYVGALTRRKGVYDVLDAFKALTTKLSNVCLTICGGGEEYEDVQKKLINDGLVNSVHLLGYVSETRLKEEYSKADVFLYLSQYEGFGYTPVEAMAQKIPVLALKTDVTTEIIGNSGILVDSLDPMIIAKELLIILTKEKISRELIEQGALRVKRYDNRIVTEQILNLYKTLV